MPSWHQSLVLELGPGAFIVPIWSNSISTFDVWPDAWLELQARFVGGIRGTKILHIWNQRVREMVEACHIKTWAENCAYQHWKFACYIMSLSHERWARRMLQWQPFGRGPVGRPAMHWASKFEQFGRIKHWCDWKDMAANVEQWMVEVDDFVKRSRVLFTPVFALVRALKRATLSACEPQTSDLRPSTNLVHQNTYTKRVPDPRPPLFLDGADGKIMHPIT